MKQPGDGVSHLLFFRFLLGRPFIEATFRQLPLFSGYSSESPEPGLFIRNPTPRRFRDGWPPLELPGAKNIANLSDALCLPSFSRWHQGKPPAAAGSPSWLRGGNESNGPLKDTSKYIRKMHPWAISYNRAEVSPGPPSPLQHPRLNGLPPSTETIAPSRGDEVSSSYYPPINRPNSLP